MACLAGDEICETSSPANTYTAVLKGRIPVDCCFERTAPKLAGGQDDYAVFFGLMIET